MSANSLARRIPSGVADWFTAPVPKGRIAAYRTVIYLFVIADLLYFTTWIRGHADVPGELYQPLLVGRLLPLPVPTAGLVHGVYWALLITGLLAATGRFPRFAGWAVFALYAEWMIIAMSYGKVDHDRVALLVALAVLPTLGRTRHGDRTLTEAGGWALRMVQLAVVATYFLAAMAKFRYAGLDWFTGATLTSAVLRRGTTLSAWLVDTPALLVVGQFAIIGFELASPVVFFLKRRAQYLVIAGFYVFHLVTYLALEIAFWPQLAAMLCFLPIEKVRPLARLWSLIRRQPYGTAGPPRQVAEPTPTAPQPAPEP
ncbi:MAG: MFS transporter permease [Micromonosporaceae bacterium]